MIRATLLCLSLAFAVGCASDGAKKTTMAPAGASKPDKAVIDKPLADHTSPLDAQSNEPGRFNISNDAAISGTQQGWGGPGLRDVGGGGSGSRIGGLGGPPPSPTSKGITIARNSPRFEDGGVVVGLGAPLVLGALSQNSIWAVLHKHLARIRSCYDGAGGPGLEGVVTLKILVDKEGKVGSATVKHSDLPDKLNACVAKIAQRMLFRKPTGGGIVIFSQPFVFEKLAP